jgi:hypothetical protein
MIRTPLYSAVPSAPSTRGVVESRGRDAGFAGPAQPGQEAKPREPGQDGYLTKVVKYVPVEFVGPFAALVALTTNVSDNPDTKEWFVRALFFIGALVTPLVFYAQSRKLVNEDKPRLYFYGLSLLAFMIWSIAASDQVRNAFGITDGLSEFLLAAGAFGIPGADWLLTTLTSPTEQPVPAAGDGANG